MIFYSYADDPTHTFHFFKQFLIFMLLCLKYHSGRARLPSLSAVSPFSTESAINWRPLLPSIGGAQIRTEQFAEGDLKACTLF